MFIISCTCDRVTLYQFWAIWRDSKSFILSGRFNLEACNVCKYLMNGCHNLLVCVKVIKNVKRPSCLIIKNKFFPNLSNNQVNYISLVNHDNLNVIWKYYLNLVYLVLKKILPHNFPFCIHTQPKPMTFYMETSLVLKKRSKI